MLSFYTSERSGGLRSRSVPPYLIDDTLERTTEGGGRWEGLGFLYCTALPPPPYSVKCDSRASWPPGLGIGSLHGLHFFVRHTFPFPHSTRLVSVNHQHVLLPLQLCTALLSVRLLFLTASWFLPSGTFGDTWETWCGLEIEIVRFLVVCTRKGPRRTCYL